MLAGNLRWLLEAGRQVELSRASDPRDYLEPYCARFRKAGTVTWTVMLGVGPGAVLAKARKWSEREGITP